MTKLEFPGSALTTDQWAQVSRLATSLSQEQAIWISGYFAGLSHQARTAAAVSDIAELAPPFQVPPRRGASDAALDGSVRQRDRKQQGTGRIAR